MRARYTVIDIAGRKYDVEMDISTPVSIILEAAAKLHGCKMYEIVGENRNTRGVKHASQKEESQSITPRDRKSSQVGRQEQGQSQAQGQGEAEAQARRSISFSDRRPKLTYCRIRAIDARAQDELLEQAQVQDMRRITAKVVALAVARAAPPPPPPIKYLNPYDGPPADLKTVCLRFSRWLIKDHGYLYWQFSSSVSPALQLPQPVYKPVLTLPPLRKRYLEIDEI